MKTDILIRKCIAFNKHIGSIYSRLDTVSFASCLRVLAILMVCLTVFGVGDVWGADFSTTYNYSGQGTYWTITNAEDAASYYKTSSSSDCVVTVSGIFTGKTITSDVVITLDVACFSTGSNPTSSKFSIYNSSACSSQVTASQGGTLPSSSTYTNATYTISKANAIAGFTNDLAIKIASGTKLIRFRSFKVEFSYTTPSTYTIYVPNSAGGCSSIGSYSSNKGTSGSGTGGWTGYKTYTGITAGTSVTITATPESGYKFDGWTDDDVSIIWDDEYNEITPSTTTSTTATFEMPSADVYIMDCAFSTACAYSMTISKGTGTNCSFSLGTTGSQFTCSGASTTVSITPNTGYGTPVVSQSGASATPTITGTGTNSQTVTYGSNTTGTSTINVSCSANTYTVTLNDNTGSGGSGSKTVTYNASTNLTTSVAVPTKAHHDFAGYWTSTDGGSTFGTQLVNADGSWKASVATFTDKDKNWIKASGVTLYAKWTEHDLINYRTRCCTVLDAIDGTATMTGTETTMTISNWSDVSNASSYTVRLYKWNSGTSSWGVVSGSTTGGSSGTQGTRTSIATDSKSVTWSGIEYGATYKVTVEAIGNNTTYCDGAETAIDEINSQDLTDNKITWKYSIYIDDGTKSDTGWGHHYIESLTSNAGSVDIELESDVDYYQYKLVLAGLIWYGNTGKMTSSNCTSWTFSTGASNCKIQTALAGDYTFGLATGTPAVSVTYPTANQSSGYKIWFDKSAVSSWGSNIYYRIGKPGNHTNNTKTGGTSWTAVPGTDDFYVTETMAYDGFEAWQIANNTAWCDDKDDTHSIYTVYNNDDTYDITYATTFQKYVVGSDGITLIATTEKNTEDGCSFRNVSKSDGMLTHTATITTPSHGTITIAYTDVNSTSQSKTATTSGLAHRTVLTITATPATGYNLTSLTVDGNAHTSGNTYILDDDATIAATFTAQTSTVTLQATSATSGSNQTVSATYDASMPLVTTADGTPAVVAISRTGYNFNGWWDATSDGKQYYSYVSSTIASANNWDKTGSQTLYAQWIAKQTTVSFNQNSGTGGQTSSVTATYDAAMPTPITCPTREGHTFGGYYESTGGTGTKYYNADGSSATTWDQEDATWTLYAKWTVNPYKVTLESPGNVTISATTPSITEGNYANANYGSTVQLSYTGVTSGMTWGGWKVYKDGDPSTTVTVTSNQFTMPAYDVIVDAIVYSAGIAWCDPDVTVTGDVHLTSTKDVYVHSTSGAGNLISISSSDMGSATKMEVGYLDENEDEIDKAESPFRLYNSTASSTIDEEDLDYGWDVNYSLRYTPTDYSQLHNYKLQLTFKRGDKVLKTVTHDINGRSLPEEFAIVFKNTNDSKWYTLPSNLAGTQEAQDRIGLSKAIEVEVDNTTTPTKVVLAPNTRIYKGTGRNTATNNINGIRFTNDGSHWLQTGSSVNKLWLSGSNSDNNQVFYLKSTDFNTYELAMDPSQSPTKKLGIYSNAGEFIGYAASIHSNIYFLPIEKSPTELMADATDWTDDIIQLTAEGVSDVSATKIVAINEAGDVETSKVAFSTPATDTYLADFNSGIDFTGLTNEMLTLKWYNNSDELVGLSWAKVPSIILAGDNDEWSDFASAPTLNDIVVLTQPMTVNAEHAKAKQIVMDKSGGNSGKLTIEPNKGLEVASTVKVYSGTAFGATTEADLVLESSSSEGNASLIFNNSNACQATVQQYSKAAIVGDTWNWQYVGTPFTGSIPGYNYYGSWMYKWNNGWDVVHGDDILTPFAGYCLTQESATTHVMGGTLVATDGNDQTITMSASTDMVLANSWTAPIYIDAFTTEGEGATFTSEPATIYMFNTGSAEYGSSPGTTEAGTYVALPVHSATSFGVEFIPSMQGFFVTTNGGEGKAGKITLKYDELVRPDKEGYRTSITTGQMYAPKRVNKPEVMKIMANGSKYSDRVVLLERADFSQGFDNGWDGKKMSFGSESPSVYVINEQGGYDAVSAIPTFEGTVVGFRAGTNNSCTMSFEYDGDETLYLNDLQAQQSTLISEENSYTFTTSANDSEVRFIISATPIQKVPTGIGNDGLMNDGMMKVRKIIINDHVYIIRNGRMYDATGIMVK